MTGAILANERLQIQCKRGRVKRVSSQNSKEEMEVTMKSYSKVFFGVVFLFSGLGISNLQAQESPIAPTVLHIHQSQTTAPPNTSVPTFLATYQVLDGAKSPTNVLSLQGTLSLKNDSQNFSQVLWTLVYWKGKCPAHDIDLTKIAGFLWSDITKNPSHSENSFPVNLVFPHPLPATGCIGLYYGGGTVFAGNATMTADLDLTYQPASSVNPNTVVNVGGGEYCFGADSGCQNATVIDEEAFAVPTTLPAGHLLEIYGNISDSTFDGTNNFGPIPTGASWGTVNDFYLLPGGCGIFRENLNSSMVSNPAPLSTLQSWLPKDALHLVSVPQVDRIPPGGSGEAALQNKIETIFSVPVKVNAGDCMVEIFGRRGNGATDNETQVLGLMGP
jgi:hypothetical protein